MTTPMEVFNIACDDGNGGAYLETREGERITIKAVPCFIHSEIDYLVEYFVVTHAETGKRISDDTSRESAINKAELRLKTPSAARVIMEARRELKALKIDLPVNK